MTMKPKAVFDFDPDALARPAGPVLDTLNIRKISVQAAAQIKSAARARNLRSAEYLERVVALHQELMRMAERRDGALVRELLERHGIGPLRV